MVKENPISEESEEVLISVLRPQTLKEYVGQAKVKDSLNVFIKAARLRKEPMEHVLIYGPPGLGKTTLANILARETNSQIKISSGPAIERAGDLVSILTNLEDSDILFIDEIHRLNKVVEEVLYTAMEDYAVDLVIGKGPSAKSLRVDLPRFTLVGATTRISLISSPMRDRFGIVYSLDFYSDEELEQIVQRSSGILSIKVDKSSVSEIAKRSRKTPRIANRLLKRVRDFATVYNNGEVSRNLTVESLNRIGVDQKGLDEIDRKVLKTIISHFDGGPVGLDTLAAATAVEKSTIEEVVEPFLMQIGYLKRTPKGRMATAAAYIHLGVKNKS